ncbi:MAG: MFS transporter [Patescibacteria group bacterium]
MNAKKTLKDKNHHRLSILYVLALLLAFSGALPAYIQSNFLEQFVGVRTVSLFFVIANALSVVAILLFPALIKNLTNYFLTKVVLALYLASLLGLALAAEPIVALVSIALFTISTNLVWINMDILVESFSDNKITGKIRTTYFTFINASWIISPLLSSFLISRGQYTLSFLIAGFMLVPFYLIFVYTGRKLKQAVKYQEEGLLLTLRKMWNNKNLRGIFFIALLLQLFFNSAVVYIPLYLFQNLGMDWNSLGIVFSIMLIPFVLIEMPAGVFADRYGTKKILAAGFTILTVSLFLFYYIAVPNIWLWALVLFISRIGAALVEAMRETYFFKIVDVESIGYINIFRATAPLGYVLGSSLAIAILCFFPINYVFLFFALIMLSGFGFIAALKDTK